MPIKRKKLTLPFSGVKSKIIGGISCAVGFVFSANISAQSLEDFQSYPAMQDNSAVPMVMLAMSRDNQLWHKAYNDYSDLNGDGVLDTTYLDSFEYFGYFHPDLCYDYITPGSLESAGLFEPVRRVAEGTHRCTGTADGQWSGNFLNWLTMTRMDVVRKVLYGGYRYVDGPATASPTYPYTTVLQRALVPSDNHAFVKIARGSNHSDSSVVRMSFPLSDFTPFSNTAMSFCNVTDIDNGDHQLSGNINTNNNPPKLKIAIGSFPSWAGSESEQCQYSGSNSGEGGDASYSPSRPTADEVGGTEESVHRTEYIVRVASCSTDDGLDATDDEFCRAYTNNAGRVNYKPYGLLQKWGEGGKIKFGLITGSHENNTEGGVLRKNITFLGGDELTPGHANREINENTGVFTNRSEGIINTLDSMRVEGWHFALNDYPDCAEPGISEYDFLNSSDGGEQCSDWGNPISEIYIEALRYFAGASANPEFTSDVSSLASWSDPFEDPSTSTTSEDAPCTKCSIIVLSTGLNNFDGDQLGGAAFGLPGMGSTEEDHEDVSVSDTGSEFYNAILSIGEASIKGYTNEIGSAEGLDSGTYIFGSTTDNYAQGDETEGATFREEECSAKTISGGNLGSISGPCPEVPSLGGTYNIAGAAYYAHSQDLRADIPNDQTIKTYTVSLAESLPSFEIPTSNGHAVTVVPTCQANSDGSAHPTLASTAQHTNWAEWRPCSLVDLIVDEQKMNADGDLIYGRLVIAWEDSTWGNDYDMDAYSVVEYCTASSAGDCDDYTREANNLYSTRGAYNGYDWTVHESMPGWQSLSGQIQIRVSVIAASAGHAMKFGYTLSGSVGSDGVYPNEVVRFGGYDGVASYFRSSQSGVDADGDGVMDNLDLCAGSNQIDFWHDSDGDHHWVQYLSTFTPEVDSNGCDARYLNVCNYGTDPSTDNLINEEVVLSDHYIDGCLHDHDFPQRQYTIWSENARAFTAAESTPGELQNPLWYAAKYGNFSELDVDANNLPDEVGEWDGWGESAADGVPDAYFPVKDPSKLQESLDEILGDINNRISSGSAASVNAQTGSGEGAIYQALYTPHKTVARQTVSWFGNLNSLFLDDQGRFREDHPTNGIQGVLDNNDRVLNFEYDTSLNRTMVTAFSVNAADESTGEQSGEPFSLESSSFNPIWSAHEQLNTLVGGLIESDGNPIRTNRSYTTPVYSSDSYAGRYIFTAFDGDEPLDGHGSPNASYGQVIDPGDGSSNDTLVAFESGNFTGEDVRYLGFSEELTYTGSGDLTFQTDIDNLVNYIRGEEINGFRSRSIVTEVGTDTQTDYYMLGDIVNSSPVMVGKPGAGYDSLYGDSSYADFVELYSDRRNVLYVGANDGMLHAFNAGFFKKEIVTGEGAPTTATVSFNLSDGNTDSPAAEHPLGSELWAYIPYNLLPHLQWLKDPQYTHVSFVDGSIQAFDVNIFPASDDRYPGGWGTILVAGMRFGGGEYSITHDGNPKTLRSAYVILDITYPEEPPKLIAEITHPDLGYTTSKPQVIKYRNRNSATGAFSPENDGWYLVFGSGPDGTNEATKLSALNNATSNTTAKVFAFDLVNRTTEIDMIDIATAENSFTGDFAVADWNSDFNDDAIYFGTVGAAASVSTPATGSLKRGAISFSGGSLLSVNDVFNAISRPFSAAPLVHTDVNNDNWIFAGTGRFFVAEDNVTQQQHYMFGFKEPENSSGALTYATIGRNQLVNTSDVDVYTDGSVYDSSGVGEQLYLGVGSGSFTSEDDQLNTFAELRSLVASDASQGWMFELSDPVPRSDPDDALDQTSIRITTSPVLAGSTLVVAAYSGSGQLCDAEGNGLLFTPHFAAGAAGPFAPVGIDESASRQLSSADSPDDVAYPVLQGVDLGVGMPSQQKIIRPANAATGDDSPCANTGEYMAIGNISTAKLNQQEITCDSIPTGRKGWREIPVNW